MKLIDANRLRDAVLALPNCYNGYSGTYDKSLIIGLIDEQIVVDAVPVVRCRDCKHFKRDIPCVGGTYNGCDELEGRDGCELYVEEDFFCAYGERRTDAD